MAAVGSGAADVYALTRAQLEVFANPRADHESVKAAESALMELGGRPGFSQVVLHFLEATAPPLPPSIRLLALTTLTRSVIAKHWAPLKDHVVVVPDDDKAAVRARLPLLLGDADGKVRTAAAVALGKIGHEDWPRQWPTFLDGMLACFRCVISDAGDINPAADAAAWLRAEGALVCLEEFSRNVDTDAAPLLAATVLPSLIGLARMGSTAGAAAPAIGANSVFGLWVRTRCLRIARDIIDTLCVSQDAGKEARSQVKAVLRRDLMPLLAAVACALGTPGWGGRVVLFKTAAVMVVAQLVQAFPNVLAAGFPPVLAGLLAFAGQAAQAFARVELDGPTEDDETEELSAARRGDGVTAGPLDASVVEVEDESATPPSLVTHALLNLLQAAYCCPEEGISGPLSAPEATAVTTSLLLTCAQLSTSLLSGWADDPDSFLREESEDIEAGLGSSSMRQDVRDAARDLVDVAGYEALHTLMSACVAGLAGSLPAWTAGASSYPPTLALSPRRWKEVEACIFVLGAVRKYLNSSTAVEGLLRRSAPRVVVKGKPKSKKAKAAAAAGAPPETRFPTVKEAPPASGLPIDPPTFAGQLIALITDGGAGAFDATDAPAYRAAHSPYVLGRCLWCASGLAPALDESKASSLLSVATEGLQPAHGLPIRVAACKALVRLLRRVPTTAVEAVAPAIISRLRTAVSDAVAEATAEASRSKPEAVAAGGVRVNDTALILLDLLVHVVAHAPVAAAAQTSELTVLLAQLWVRHGTHPELFDTLSAGLQALICNPAPAAAMASLLAQLPTLVSVLQAAIAFATAPKDAPVAADVVLPGGGAPLRFTREAVAADQLPRPSSLAAMGMTILTTMLRRAREMLPPAPAGSLPAGASPPLSLAALAMSGNAAAPLPAGDAAAAAAVTAAIAATGPPPPAGAYVQLPPQLSSALAVGCRLLTVTEDHSVMEAGAETLTVAVRLAGTSLLVPPSPDAAAAAAAAAAGGAGAAPLCLTPDLFLAAPARMLSAETAAAPETSAPGAKLVRSMVVPDTVVSQSARLVAALISHARFPGLVEGVVPALLHRLAAARLPSTVARLLHALAHAVIVAGVETVGPVMLGVTVRLPPSGPLAAHADLGPGAEQDAMAARAAEMDAAGAAVSQNGLLLFARTTARFFSLLDTPLTKALLCAALAGLLRVPVALESLSSITVQGERTEAVGGAGKAGGGGSSVADRTRKKVGATKQVQVPLSVRLLTLVIKEWAMLVGEEESEAGDGSSDEDEDDDEDRADAGAGSGRGTYTRGRAAGSRFVDADAARDVYGLGSDDDDDDDDSDDDKGLRKDELLLADLLGGGDGGLGTGMGLAALMRAAQEEEDRDEDGDEDEEGGDGVANRYRREFDDEEVARIAEWDEIEDEDVTAAAAAAAAGVGASGGAAAVAAPAPLPHDPVITMFTRRPFAVAGAAVAGGAAAGGAGAAAPSAGAAEASCPRLAPQTAHLTLFLANMAAEATRNPASLSARVVGATNLELSDDERSTLMAKLSAAR